MKKTLINTIIAATVLLTAGCSKDVTEIDYTAPRTFVDPSVSSLLKINYMSLYAGNTGVQLSINNQRVSGLVTNRTPFPGGGYNTNGSNFADYLVVKPGANILSIAIPKRLTNVDSIALFSAPITVEAGKNYTAHIADTSTKTKLFLLEDDLALPDTGSVKYRFINLMPNAPFVDLYYGTDRMATNIAYLAASPIFTMRVPPILLAWTIRETGTLPTSTALATFTSANTYLTRRVYSAFAVGYKGSTAANTRPYISFNLNK